MVSLKLPAIIGCMALLLLSLAQVLSAAQSCSLDDATAYKRRVEAVKAQILSKLGMTEPPEFNASLPMSGDVLRTYRAAIMRRRRRSVEQLEDTDPDTGGHHYYSKPINLVDVTGNIVRDHHDYVALLVDQQHLRQKLVGNLSFVYEAELNLAFIPPKDKDGATSHEVRVELFEKHTPVAGSAPRARFVDGLTVDLSRRQHIVLDIKAVLLRWLKEPCANSTCRLEMHVHAVHRDELGAVSKFVNGIMPRRKGQSARKLRDAHVYVVSHSHLPNARRLRRRTKRQTLNGEYCRSTRGRNMANCCLKDLELNFKTDLGWDWVHEPKKFKPNRCAGACPYRWSSGSAYSSVISMYNNINPQASAKPCCVADQLGSVVLLFQTGAQDSSARIEELSMMTVQTCKCR